MNLVKFGSHASNRKNFPLALHLLFAYVIRTVNDVPAVYRPHYPRISGWYRCFDDFNEPPLPPDY